jgi:hypothetical protein
MKDDGCLDRPSPWYNSAEQEALRQAMGHTRRLAERMNLAAMTPEPRLASTRYCLAHPGTEYLIYQPNAGESFSVDLAPGGYTYQWFNPANGETAARGKLEAAVGGQKFNAPFGGTAVIHLKRTNRD